MNRRLVHIYVEEQRSKKDGETDIPNAQRNDLAERAQRLC